MISGGLPAVQKGTVSGYLTSSTALKNDGPLGGNSRGYWPLNDA
jgi:hypothetical protein